MNKNNSNRFGLTISECSQAYTGILETGTQGINTTHKDFKTSVSRRNTTFRKKTKKKTSDRCVELTLKTQDLIFCNSTV